MRIIWNILFQRPHDTAAPRDTHTPRTIGCPSLYIIWLLLLLLLLLWLFVWSIETLRAREELDRKLDLVCCGVEPVANYLRFGWKVIGFVLRRAVNDGNCICIETKRSSATSHRPHWTIFQWVTQSAQTKMTMDLWSLRSIVVACFLYKKILSNFIRYCGQRPPGCDLVKGPYLTFFCFGARYLFSFF